MFRSVWATQDRLCGLVVRVPGYRSRGPGSILGATTFSEEWIWKGSTQPREYNRGATWKKSSGLGLENQDYGRRGSASLTTRHPCIRKKLALTSPTSGGSSVGIVRLRTKATELLLLYIIYDQLSQVLCGVDTVDIDSSPASFTVTRWTATVYTRILLL
jgi:hypothetical protein